MPDTPINPLDPAATDETAENARDGARKRRDPNEPAAVIGIGASAGGIAPLQQFFGDMKPDTGLAFVVVMHLSPEHESNLASVIQQKTAMPVIQVSEPVKVQPDHVYVIPPLHQLTFNDGMLELVPPQQEIGRRVAIDLFFRTLAMNYGQRAVCVIMSGTDSDGVIGLKHVRAQGGLTIVQDPNEAQFDSMPATAISTGMVDWVLPVGEMANKLVEFVDNENRMRLPPEILGSEEPDEKVEEAPGGETVSDETRDPADEDAILKVLADVRAQTGHDFSHYKRATVLRRIARRLQVNSLETIPEYVGFMRTHPSEARALLQDLLIGVTHFFRDRDAFSSFEAHVPQLFAGKKKDDELRVWVAGCATGEEAYSIAMLLCEHAARLDSPPSIEIFATDIAEESIADARDALYPSMIEADVSPERLRGFFVRDHGRYRVRKEIREKVLFAAHNVLRDPPFSRCDLISCRNLLIYLNTDAQKTVFDTFHFALRSGGLLFLGGAENQSQGQGLFSPVDAKHRIFVRRSTPRPAWKVPALPLRPAEPMGRRPHGWRSRPLPALTHDIADHAAQGGAVPILAGQARRELLFGELHLRLLEQYGPPSVVVNEAHEIVHLSESAGRYLQFVAGEPTANLTRVINPALQIELRTALFRAAQAKQAVKAAPVSVKTGDSEEVITLEVRPMDAADEAQGFFLVLFERAEDRAGTPDSTPAAPAGPISREADEEIQSLKQQLATTVEQYEAANEELKASNEELQAMNEEMRSATEELETSKEELQSVNEELTTVNHELKANVEELSGTNADLSNLMASTDIGTVFLDRQLRIHRYTPSAQRIFNLLPSDLGRPLSDITNKLQYAGLIRDCEEVLERLVTIEREVSLDDHEVATDERRWYLLRIAPYRTQEDRIAGVVATFIDITRRKRAEEDMRRSEERYRTLFNSMDEAYYVLEMIFDATNRPVDYRILESNPAFAKLTGLTNATGRTVRELVPAIEPTWIEHYGQVALSGESARMDGQVGGLGGRWYDGYAFRVGGSESRQVAVVFSEVTERKRVEQALRDSEGRFRDVANNVPQVIWTNTADGLADYFNKRWYDYTGLSDQESVGPGWQAIVHPEDAGTSIARWRDSFAKGEVFDAEYRLRGRDGEYRWFLGRNVPLHDTAGRVTSWFGTATDIEDLKKAQATLGETEEKFQLLVEGTPDYAMFLMDPENNITYWSAGAEKVFGWAAAEAIGQKGELIFTEQDKVKGDVEKEFFTALEQGRAPDRRWHVRKNGTQLWVDGVMRRIDRADGSLRGFAKICRDATDQREIEDALRHARDELEQRVLERTRDLLATNNELKQTMAQRQELEKELLEISEREKRRIGEDLHDGVCQELTATALFLKSSAKAVAAESAAAAEMLNESAEIVNRNVGMTRDLARGLQPADLKGAGLKDALRALAAQACENVMGVQCHFKATRGVRVTDDNAALHLYRVAQEALNNAMKHARAKNILISLDKSKENICVSVQDDGKGFSPTRKCKGLGLHIMRYRAKALGGELKIERRQSGGMDITCVIPMKKRGAQSSS